MTVYMGTESFVPMISQWQLQSDNDIYDAVDDWEFHRFLCIMKDGNQVFASGYADESYDGFATKDISIDGDYTMDDILFWLEFPKEPDFHDIEHYGEEKIKEYIHSYRTGLIEDIKNGKRS